jgi:nucleoside-diphosphate kinase
MQYDIKNHKIFLKKIQYPEIKLPDLYIGNVVTCLNRQLKIVAFGDEFTRKQLVGEDSSNK